MKHGVVNNFPYDEVLHIHNTVSDVRTIILVCSNTAALKIFSEIKNVCVEDDSTNRNVHVSGMTILNTATNSRITIKVLDVSHRSMCRESDVMRLFAGLVVTQVYIQENLCDMIKSSLPLIISRVRKINSLPHHDKLLCLTTFKGVINGRNP